MTAMIRELPLGASPEQVLIAFGINPEDFYSYVNTKNNPGQSIRPRVTLALDRGIREWKDQVLSKRPPTTRVTYQGVIDGFLSFMLDRWRHDKATEQTVDQVTEEDVQDFLDLTCGRGGREAAAQSVNKRLAILRSFFTKFLIRKKKVLHWDPSDGIDRVAEDKLPPVALNRTEQTALLDLARATRYGIRNHTMLFLAVNTGLRASELVEVQFRDVDLARGSLMVPHGKGDKCRSVPLLAGVRRVLGDFMELRKNGGAKPASRNGSYLFLNQEGVHRGRKMTRDGLERMAGPLFDQIGRPGVNVHCLRHTFAVKLLDAGMHLRGIQELLGHARLETTSRYLRLGDAKIREELEAHCPFAVHMPQYLQFLFGEGQEGEETGVRQAH